MGAGIRFPYSIPSSWFMVFPVSDSCVGARKDSVVPASWAGCMRCHGYT